MLKEQHLVGLFFTVTGSGKLASTRVCQSLDVRKTTNVQDLFAVSMFPTRQGNAPAGLCLHFFYVHVCVCVHDCLDFSLRLGKENIIDSLSIVPFHLMILDLWADYHPSNFLSSLIFLRAFYPATLFALLGLLLILSPERTLQSDTAQHAVHRSFSQQKHVLLPDVSTHFISHFLSASQLTKLALTKKTDRADDNQKAQGLCCHVFPKKVDELAVLSHEVVDNRMIH